MTVTSLTGLSPHVLANMLSDSFWRDRLNFWIENDKSFGVHLAVFSAPFLEYVLAGTKTVDSRFSKNRIAPFDHVAPGDMILIKETSGPVVAVCAAEQVWFYELDQTILRDIKQRFGRLICANDEFWKSRRQRSFGTLIC